MARTDIILLQITTTWVQRISCRKQPLKTTWIERISSCQTTTEKTRGCNGYLPANNHYKPRESNGYVPGRNPLPQLRLGIQGRRWSRWMSLASRGPVHKKKKHRKGGNRCHQGRVMERTNPSGKAPLLQKKGCSRARGVLAAFSCMQTNSVHATAKRNRIHRHNGQDVASTNQSRLRQPETNQNRLRQNKGRRGT